MLTYRTTLQGVTKHLFAFFTSVILESLKYCYCSIIVYTKITEITDIYIYITFSVILVYQVKLNKKRKVTLPNSLNKKVFIYLFNFFMVALYITSLCNTLVCAQAKVVLCI